jgi:hypothetical protein
MMDFHSLIGRPYVASIDGKYDAGPFALVSMPSETSAARRTQR